MGREPLSLRIAPLTSLSCDSVVLCGISNRFRLLSPSKRQVAHALLTRSPLNVQSTNHSAEVSVTLFCLRDCFAIPRAVEAIGASYIPFDLHVLGTPPAFVLSQDQTLEFNLLNASQRFAHFFSLGRVFRVRNSLISRSELTWLVVDALYSFQGASPSVLRDSFVSILHSAHFVNTFFHFF